MTYDKGTLPARLSARWRRAALQSHWPGLLAVLLMAGLLVAFHQVVSGGVTQAASRHAQAAAQASALQRCRASAGMPGREACGGAGSSPLPER